MPTTRLRWSPDGWHTIPERFAVQHEQIRHEGHVWSLMCLRPEDESVLNRSDIETAFYGRGGSGKVRRAAQQLADLVDAQSDEVAS